MRCHSHAAVLALFYLFIHVAILIDIVVILVFAALLLQVCFILGKRLRLHPQRKITDKGTKRRATRTENEGFP